MHCLPNTPPQVCRTRLRGFTLVEVMISIAIAMILILGISQIFSLAQRTTATGTTILAATESNRGVQEVLLNDFRSMDNGVDSPGLVIASYPVAVFRSPQDQAQDRDGIPQTFNDPSNNTGNIKPELPTTIDDRIHRSDVICYFARGNFTRQTGNRQGAVCLTSPTTSGEAFIWMGHLSLPDNTALLKWNYLQPANPGGGAYWGPGVGSAAANPNNFYASQWALGREVMLLDPTPDTTVDAYFFAAPGGSFDPLSLWSSTSTDPQNVPLLSSRYDLVATSIAAYRNFIPATSLTWWQGLSGILTGTSSPGGPPPTVKNQQRYEANPFIIKPGTATGATVIPQLSAALAQASPIFVRGCTQFIVEFAGDYLKQNTAGTILGPGQDGQIDFAIDSNGARQIRWYGFPRATSLNGAAADVTPVSTAALVPAGSPLPSTLIFERSRQPNGTTWVTTTASMTNGLPSIYSQPYVCAWGPDTDAASIPRPKMIRITLAIDDPSGRLNTEQVYEYVYTLP